MTTGAYRAQSYWGLNTLLIPFEYKLSLAFFSRVTVHFVVFCNVRGVIGDALGAALASFRQGVFFESPYLHRRRLTGGEAWCHCLATRSVPMAVDIRISKSH